MVFHMVCYAIEGVFSHTRSSALTSLEGDFSQGKVGAY